MSAEANFLILDVSEYLRMIRHNHETAEAVDTWLEQHGLLGNPSRCDQIEISEGGVRARACSCWLCSQRDLEAAGHHDMTWIDVSGPPIFPRKAVEHMLSLKRWMA